MKTVFLTGATSGIGKATAELLAANGYNLILSGRREERLKELQERLSHLADIHILKFDVREKENIPNIIASLPEAFKKIDILINNAGNAYGRDPIHEGLIEDWENMIDINLKGMLYLTRAISPQMVERKSGHILNIASLAGRETYPNGAVYCASKSAVKAATEGIRKDLNPYGIKVSCIDPGLVETEFSEVRFHGDKEEAKKVYQGYIPLTAFDVAETIEFVLSRPPHVNIADTLILCADQASSTIVRKE
ncbi:MAG: SDR family NAD(P)-dependent oxidoreductase [Salibacteraceae bacterium]|nr:SDR family NAD(P)-dependent oxidoreductase [Salibacteraceae bacterium]|tara:strand:- start:60691 stop:61440 length:750 start_codon:yes stop_codon:yes gene_type:complete